MKLSIICNELNQVIQASIGASIVGGIDIEVEDGFNIEKATFYTFENGNLLYNKQLEQASMRAAI